MNYKLLSFAGLLLIIPCCLFAGEPEGIGQTKTFRVEGKKCEIVCGLLASDDSAEPKITNLECTAARGDRYYEGEGCHDAKKHYDSALADALLLLLPDDLDDNPAAGHLYFKIDTLQRHHSHCSITYTAQPK